MDDYSGSRPGGKTQEQQGSAIFKQKTAESPYIDADRSADDCAYIWGGEPDPRHLHKIAVAASFRT